MTKEEYYEALFYRCEYIAPGLKPVIDYIRENSDISLTERKKLYKEFESGDTTAKNRFIAYFMRTSLDMAYSFSKRTGMDLEDLYSKALETMLSTINTFTFKGESYLYTYVCSSITHRLNTYVRKHRRQSMANMPLDCALNRGYDGEEWVFQCLYRKELRETIKEILDEDESTIILMKSGLWGDAYEYTYPEIARELHLKLNVTNDKFWRGVRKLKISKKMRDTYLESNEPAPQKQDKEIAPPEISIKLQFYGSEFDIEEIQQKVMADCTAKNKERVQTLEIYIKPEDHAAYYVADAELFDKIDI